MRVDTRSPKMSLETLKPASRIDPQTLELRDGPYAGSALPELLHGDDAARRYLRYLACWAPTGDLREAAQAAHEGAAPDEIRDFLRGFSDA